MTYEEKVAAYRAGQYFMPVPPVSTLYWSEHHWISFIDTNGSWRT